MKTKKITALGFFGGLFLGIRFTDAPIVIGLFGFLIFKKRSFLYSLTLLGGFLLGIAFWLAPVVYLTGLGNFRKANAETANYVIWHDALLGKPFAVWEYAKDRITNLTKLLSISYTPVVVISSAVSLFSILSKRLLKALPYQFFAVYFLSYFVPLAFLSNLELAQYTLPLSPIFATLLSLLLYQYRKQFLSWVVFLLITFYLFARSFQIVRYQSQSEPPTIASVSYVKEKLDPLETTLITTFTFRQFQYYAQEFENYYGVNSAPVNIESRFVVVDYKELKNQIPDLSKYKMFEEKKFGESKNTFVRLKRTDLYILERD